MDWFIVLLSSLLSGLIGVGISNWYHRKSEIKRTKIRLIEHLLGNRYYILGDAFTEALNKVFIVFHDSKEVKSALKAFHEITMSKGKTADLANQKLLELFKAMCKDVNIDQTPLTDNFF